jgi:RHS repeat-associated protein
VGCWPGADNDGARQITTRVYDPLNRLISATYSTGEVFEYAYDAVGNRTAMTTTEGSTTYTYDAANRLTSVGGVPYTWDARGNLIGNGVFTYTYNGAGRMVQAESLDATLVYTYTADSLRVAQSVDGDVTTFAWDWASSVPEMLRDGENLYLVGHDTLGRFADGEWAYYLPDALGSVRQVADGAGAVVSSREWTPFGVEVGAAQAGLGYTGEWWDGDAGLLYLRARWYEPYLNQFISPDTIVPDFRNPQSINRYLYALANPINYIDPTGRVPSPDHSYSCRCGWIDWGHASPGTARTIKDNILVDITGGSPDYFVIDTGYASLLPPVQGFAVVRKDLSQQERQEAALGIFMSLETNVEDWHMAFEMLQAQHLGWLFTHSGYSLEDLPSDLIGFYVAWMTQEGFYDILGGPTAVEQLKEFVRPICHVLDDKDSMEVLAAFEDEGLLYWKNFEWAPFVIPQTCSAVHQVIAEKCCGVDTSWPAEFSGVVPEPERQGGKWWWWQGPWREAHIAPSEYEGVYLYDVSPPPLLGYPPIIP